MNEAVYWISKEQFDQLILLCRGTQEGARVLQPISQQIAFKADVVPAAADRRDREGEPLQSEPGPRTGMEAF